MTNKEKNLVEDLNEKISELNDDTETKFENLFEDLNEKISELKELFKKENAEINKTVKRTEKSKERFMRNHEMRLNILYQSQSMFEEEEKSMSQEIDELIEKLMK